MLCVTDKSKHIQETTGRMFNSLMNTSRKVLQLKDCICLTDYVDLKGKIKKKIQIEPSNRQAREPVATKQGFRKNKTTLLKQHRNRQRSLTSN